MSSGTTQYSNGLSELLSLGRRFPFFRCINHERTIGSTAASAAVISRFAQ
jgi:hypothetical protein